MTPEQFAIAHLAEIDYHVQGFQIMKSGERLIDASGADGVRYIIRVESVVDYEGLLARTNKKEREEFKEIARQLGAVPNEIIVQAHNGVATGIYGFYYISDCDYDCDPDRDPN